MLQMTSSDSAPLPVSAPPAPMKENITSVGPKTAELNESRTELLSRIQGLKQDLQNWRSKLNTQVKIYHDELTELKKTLNVEVEQLRTEFQELRNTLHQQHEDVTASLRNLGVSFLKTFCIPYATCFPSINLCFRKLVRAPSLNHLELLQLQDVSQGAKDAEDPKVEAKDEEVHTSPTKENGKGVEN
ncbi:uncharacterized protein LOC111292824 isoform X1 [Durio zibethinus]|uniref:Uncharacterized protein LOC111292824 isoform X1 n=1 Tax=Durio zibethinus TaxID=66656 RepID=A0A6P5YLE6_DURZI|nr:uncharacterized protein LOC111292824 isoform X1 [Durio zibethinus]